MKSLYGLVRRAEDWWFDQRRGVQTSGGVPLEELSLVGKAKDGYMYLPVRAFSARQALEDLPVTDFSEYTLIDLGSGKGKVLFLAAEYPFKRIIGVEFATELHNEAVANLSRYRHAGRRCQEIQSVNQDATDFVFPDEKLVVFLFNPFGGETLRKVLRNLDASIAQSPRDVILVLVFPESAAELRTLQHMKPYKETRRHHIYRSQI